jgi:hypothetical protein
MAKPVGVVATVGEDPGWSPEERQLRAFERKWLNVLTGSESKLRQIEQVKQGATSAKLAALEIKAEEVRREIERAKLELRKMVN